MSNVCDPKILAITFFMKLIMTESYNLQWVPFSMLPIAEHILLSGLYSSPPSTQCTPISNLPSSSRSNRKICNLF
ncbi:hypothetical protein LguiB_027455 [Lonicera macranthoides]